MTEEQVSRIVTVMILCAGVTWIMLILLLCELYRRGPGLEEAIGRKEMNDDNFGFIAIGSIIFIVWSVIIFGYGYADGAYDTLIKFAFVVKP